MRKCGYCGGIEMRTTERIIGLINREDNRLIEEKEYAVWCNNCGNLIYGTSQKKFKFQLGGRNYGSRNKVN